MAELISSTIEKIERELSFIYPSPPHDTGAILGDLLKLVSEFPRKDSVFPVTGADVWLITYGDSVRRPDEPGLRTLRELYARYLRGLITDIHILPCFPWTSDDGFSVTDYYSIEPGLGTWEDVRTLSGACRLMLDAVLNHASAESRYVKGFLEGDPEYRDFFIDSPPDDRERLVFRPRVTPLFSEFQSPGGIRRLWTTFSADQVDFNIANPAVLIELTRILLFYVHNGACAIRLDAIGYLWKELGTPCIHHPRTHAILRLWRVLLDDIARGTLLISETNVPHEDNISYFGDGGNEVHMVYQFPLPPLTIHTFQTGNARALAAWLSTIRPVSETATYFNFLASHDGIGVVPARGLLTEDEIRAMTERLTASGGLVSYRAGPDGGRAPYEMNATFFDALSSPDESESTRIAKFLAAHAILFSIVGVPAVYIHSLVGSLGDREGVLASGINRRINREKLDYENLSRELDTPGHRRNQVFEGLASLIRARKRTPAFHPSAGMKVHESDSRILVFTRRPENKEESVLVLVNCSGDHVDISPHLPEYPVRNVILDSPVTQWLPPYGVLWLAPETY